jgi:SSS family solute:Na+ symporter
MLFSTVFMIIDMLANLKVLNISLGILQSPINAGAFCMIAGLIIVPLVSLISKAPAKAEVERIFSCYNRKVVVTAKNSIETEE